MKRVFRSYVIATVTASLAAASGASAQRMTASPFDFGAYFGASLPLGSFKDQADAGFHGGAFGTFPLSDVLGLRIDGAYSDFGTKDFPVDNATASSKTTVLHGTVDLQYKLGTENEMALGGGALPYISGGLGAYRFSFDDSCAGTGCSGVVFGPDSETHWGLNGGAGALFPLSGFTPFVDVHYHTIFPKSGQTGRANMLLLSFGLKFR